MSVELRILHIIQVAAFAILAISCYMVLRPFFTAILFAVVVCLSTWPFYLRLRTLLWEKSTLAASLMVVLMVLLVIIPTALLAASLADSVTNIVIAARILLASPLMPPVWLGQIPLFGEQLNAYWHALASGGKEAVPLLTDLLEPARKLFIAASKAISHSALQMVFSAFIGFFIYRDGETLLLRLRNGVIRLAGQLGEELLISIHRTVAGVVQGIFGAALAQAIVAAAGFLIAGVPGAILLGAAIFVLSIVPIGPPLIWGAASIWLISEGSYGWAIFMVLWGVLAISSIDNIVRPYIISQRNRLSLLINVLGVFGGIISFGFIGIFIGPPILVVGLTLVQVWTSQPVKAADMPSHEPRSE